MTVYDYYALVLSLNCGPGRGRQLIEAGCAAESAGDSATALALYKAALAIHTEAAPLRPLVRHVRLAPGWSVRQGHRNQGAP